MLNVPIQRLLADFLARSETLPLSLAERQELMRLALGLDMQTSAKSSTSMRRPEGCTVNTTKARRKNIYKKLRVSGQTELQAKLLVFVTERSHYGLI